MIHKIFTIHDAAANAYLPPFCLPEQGMAMRTFGDCINDPKHQFSLHPSDYTLFRIGYWDDISGEIKVELAKLSCGNGVAYAERAGDLKDAAEVFDKNVAEAEVKERQDEMDLGKDKNVEKALEFYNEHMNMENN